MNAVATAAPGAPVYAAPEARYPDQHSPTMDTFSYGVLLVEMCVQELPESSRAQREAQILQVQWAAMVSLVRRCTREGEAAHRLSMGDFMELPACAGSWKQELCHEYMRYLHCPIMWPVLCAIYTSGGNSPIIHRDISSANVLLEPLPNGWRAKVSDYGSANFMNAVATAAPELAISRPTLS